MLFEVLKYIVIVQNIIINLTLDSSNQIAYLRSFCKWELINLRFFYPSDTLLKSAHFHTYHNRHRSEVQDLLLFFLISPISLSTSSSVLSGIFPSKKMQHIIMKVAISAKSIKTTIIHHFFSEVLYLLSYAHMVNNISQNPKGIF